MPTPRDAPPAETTSHGDMLNKKDGEEKKRGANVGKGGGPN
jgi:hypothetical protein